MLEELRKQFDLFFPCPQHEKSEGERMCSSCLDSLGWLAADYFPALLDVVEAAASLPCRAQHEEVVAALAALESAQGAEPDDGKYGDWRDDAMATGGPFE